MSQNLLSLTLTDEQLAAVDGALTALETATADLIAMDNVTRRQITKMGDKSEAFVRQTLLVLEQNPDIVPAALGLPRRRPTCAPWTRFGRCWPACSACPNAPATRKWPWAAI